MKQFEATERTFKDMTQISIPNQPQTQPAQEVLKLSSKITSIQEHLLNLSLEIESLKSSIKSQKTDLQAIYDEVTSSKPSDNEAQYKQMSHREIVRQSTVNKMKDAIKEHPEFKDNLRVIAALSGSNFSTAQKYRAEGLI